jgi:NADH:ubiquinone oxidoreductase subunit E
MEKTMEKVTVTICTGKHCHPTESAWFKQFDHILCEKMKSQIELSGSDCPGNCPFQRKATSPHVIVNGRVVSNASPLEVVQTIRHWLAPPRQEKASAA